MGPSSSPSRSICSSLPGGHAKSHVSANPSVPGTGELSVLCGAVVGAGLGFLWYNAYPAELFMGDVGSLPLGAVLGTVAVMTKQKSC